MMRSRVWAGIYSGRRIQINKQILICMFTAMVLAAGSSAWARNTIHQFSIADVMEKPENASQLQGVAYYFGEQEHPPIATNHGEFRTNKKTNAFNKTDLVACQWVMMSALLQLHQRAKSLGADAVVNIKSNYKNNEVSSDTDFTCGAGATVAGVALKGTVVKLE
jgi:hypothetical protein